VGGQTQHGRLAEGDLPLIRTIDTRNQIENRRLSGSIGTDEADNPPFFNVERDIADGCQAAKILGQAVNTEHAHPLPSLPSPAGVRSRS